MQKLKFPDKFFFGSAFSGPQTEGNPTLFKKTESIWDFWYKNDKQAFFNHDFVKNDFLTNYKEDIQLAKKMGFNSLRTSIQWTRLVPDGINVSKEAISKYREIFLYMKEQGIEPFLNLFHFDTPMWAQKMGGWLNREVVDRYVNYAKIAFKALGDIVKTWFTFNEPEGIFLGGYLYQFHYPNIVNIKFAIQIMWNTVIAHKKIIKIFRKTSEVKDGIIGSILGVSLAIPKTTNKNDVKAANFCNLFKSKYFLDSIVLNKFPQKLLDEWEKLNILPKIQKGDFDLIANNSMDILGVNYYQPERVMAPKNKIFNKKTSTLDYWYENYFDKHARINHHRGWEINPKILFDTMIMIKNQYNNIKFFISENGMGVSGEERFRKKGVIMDQYRIDFFTEHLYHIQKGIERGANCIGFHSWAYIDNWSWINGYKNRYGFVELNIETGQRKLKESAKFMTKLANTHILEVPDGLVK